MRSKYLLTESWASALSLSSPQKKVKERKRRGGRMQISAFRESAREARIWILPGVSVGSSRGCVTINAPQWEVQWRKDDMRDILPWLTLLYWSENECQQFRQFSKLSRYAALIASTQPITMSLGNHCDDLFHAFLPFAFALRPGNLSNPFFLRDFARWASEGARKDFSEEGELRG